MCWLWEEKSGEMITSRVECFVRVDQPTDLAFTCGVVKSRVLFCTTLQSSWSELHVRVCSNSDLQFNVRIEPRLKDRRSIDGVNLLKYHWLWWQTSFFPGCLLIQSFFHVNKSRHVRFENITFPIPKFSAYSIALITTMHSAWVASASFSCLPVAANKTSVSWHALNNLTL